MKGKRRIKKEKGYRPVLLLFGISTILISVFILSYFFGEIFRAPSPFPAPQKDINLDLPLTFYDTLTREKGEGRGKYTIQVGAFKDKEWAKELRDKLKKEGYSAYLVSAEASSGKNWHRVRIGHFTTKEGAKEFAQNLERKEKLPILVVRK